MKTETKIRAEIEISVSIAESSDYGCFEIWDPNTKRYAEGGLWFKDNELVDYDGVIGLEPEVMDILEGWGIDCGKMREGL